ncbi:uncharacterized protein LOC142334694 [Convolutriloba macropyga]|uniref:uncharacterized protein LOC142334694 n=1 Tax=Convolutriloba macropyga TaxID=536237 RepID=UPI003F52464A
MALGQDHIVSHSSNGGGGVSLEDAFSACDKDGDQRLSFSELILFCDVIQSNVPPAILARKLVGSQYNCKLLFGEVQLLLQRHYDANQQFTQSSIMENEGLTDLPINGCNQRKNKVEQDINVVTRSMASPRVSTYQHYHPSHQHQSALVLSAKMSAKPSIVPTNSRLRLPATASSRRNMAATVKKTTSIGHLTVGSTSCLSASSAAQSPQLLRVGGSRDNFKKTISMLSLHSKTPGSRFMIGPCSSQQKIASSQVQLTTHPLTTQLNRSVQSQSHQSQQSGLESMEVSFRNVTDSQSSLPQDARDSGQTTAVGCSLVDQLVRESCLKHFTPPLDFVKTHLGIKEQKTILHHVISQISPNGETSSDFSSIQEVVSQVHQLVICRDWPGATTDGPVTQLTPQQLSARLTSVAEGYQGEEGKDTDRINMDDNHSQGLNYESKRGDCQKRKRERCFYASKSANSSTYSSQATLDTSDHSPFIPISNDISCMNVITNTTLQMANVDPKVIQEAQVERDRECLEVNLVRCLQHMSDEGIEVHPTAAIALYLLQLIADFSRDEISELQGDVMTQSQLMRDYSEQLERAQIDFDAQLDRITAQHQEDLEIMRHTQERAMDQVRQQGERERAHMASEHKHELLKLRTQLERLDGRNCTLKEKLMDYQRESKLHTQTISKLEKETKHLMYERSCLEEQVRTHHFESLDGANSKLGSGMHGLLRLDGCHDNSGAVFSSPESTLKWDTISEGSEDVEYNRCVSGLDDGESESARNCKGSTVYLYIEHEMDDSTYKNQNKKASYEVDENLDEETRSVSAICCSIVQLCVSGLDDGESESARNCKGSTVYLYIEHEMDDSTYKNQNKKASYEVDENLDEETRSVSAICCSIVQLTQSFRNTRKKKSHSYNQDKSRTSAHRTKQRSFSSTIAKHISPRKHNNTGAGQHQE